MVTVVCSSVPGEQIQEL